MAAYAKRTSIPAQNITCPGTCRTCGIFWRAFCNSSFSERFAARRDTQGPLHRCSIYGNKVAGERLNKMLAMGASKPWPDALEALTGEKQMDATALADYFAPLKTWLDEQNKANSYAVGW